MNSPQSIEKYILQFPENVQNILQHIREMIQKSHPELSETINYGIPTFKLKGKNWVHFGAFKKHISLFPGAQVIQDFEEKLAGYHVSKGTIQFPLDREIPYELIQEILEYKIHQ